MAREYFENMIAHYMELLESGECDKDEIERRIEICKIKLKEYDYRDCKHLWVSLPSEDEYEDRLIGCVKCGFNNAYIPEFEKKFDKLSDNEKASFEYITTWSIYDMPSMHSESWCDLELGMAIYRKIKAAHPEANDEQISDYLACALCNMRTKDQSEQRKASRVKRLELRPNFNAWNPEFEQD